MEPYVMAFDVGTSGVKTAVIAADGRLLACAGGTYPLAAPRPGWAEQNPEDYWLALCAGARRAAAEAGIPPEGIAGISLCTQWKGIIPVDAQGRALHPCVIWLDARGEEEAAYLNERLGTGLFSGQSYWAKLLWLKRRRPEIYSRAAYILEVNSFLRRRMTGQWAVDVSNDFIHSPTEETDRFYRRVLEAGELDREKFPPMVDSTDQTGVLAPGPAGELGLPPGIPVFAGSADIPAVAIGAGCGARGAVHAYFGTSGWVGAVTDRQAPASGLAAAAMDRERDVVLFSLQSVGLALNWAVDQFYAAERAQLGGGIFDLLERELEDLPAGSGRLLAAPWLSGELPPLSERARLAFLNGCPLHTRRHYVNAVMEGVCYAMRQCAQRCGELRDRPLEALTVVGGGANSGRWMQMLADVLGIPVSVPADHAHAGAAGGAYCALAGLGLWRDAGAVRRSRRAERRFLPREERREEYEKMYGVYTGLYQRLEPIFTQLQT